GRHSPVDHRAMHRLHRVSRDDGQQERGGHVGELTSHREAAEPMPAPGPTERVVPGPGQESVWDYPRPPRVEAVPERLRVIVDGEVLADTTHGYRVLETAGAPVYYVPPADVRLDRLARSERRTVCEWKG